VRRGPPTANYFGSNRIELSASSNRLYGYNNDGDFAFRTMIVSSSGLSVVDTTTGLLQNSEIEFSGSRIYDNHGNVINPVTRTTLGKFAFPEPSQPFGGVAVESDPAADVVYFVIGGDLLIYNRSNFAHLDTIPIPGLSLGLFEAVSLIKTGPGRLALRAGHLSKIFLITLAPNLSCIGGWRPTGPLPPPCNSGAPGGSPSGGPKTAAPPRVPSVPRDAALPRNPTALPGSAPNPTKPR
jgi:hypothetical protein